MNDIGLLALVESLAELAVAPDTPDCKLCLPNNPCWWHKPKDNENENRT